jgi:hypothetical protein
MKTKRCGALIALGTALVLAGCGQADVGGAAAVKIKDTAVLTWTDPTEKELKGFEGVEISFSPEAPSVTQPVRVLPGEETAVIGGLDEAADYVFTVKTVKAGKLSKGVEPGWYDVYAAGDESTGRYDTQAVLWKNGIPQILSDGERDARANMVAVSGSDVYVGGDKGGKGGYWKNGEFTEVPGKYPHVLDIAVDQDTAYAAGMIATGFGEYSTWGVYYLWTNGEPAELGEWGTYEFEHRTMGIAKSGDDVYVSSLLNCWKNGEKITPEDDGNFYDIAVSGEDVYLGGSVKKTAGYWKNGVLTTLTDGENYAAARGLALSGEDVYITGYDGKVTKIWKNGDVIAETDGAFDTQGNALALLGNTPLAAGYAQNEQKRNAAVIFVGTKALAIPLTDGTQNAEAKSIVIVPR